MKIALFSRENFNEPWAAKDLAEWLDPAMTAAVLEVNDPAAGKAYLRQKHRETLFHDLGFAVDKGSYFDLNNEQCDWEELLQKFPLLVFSEGDPEKYLAKISPETAEKLKKYPGVIIGAGGGAKILLERFFLNDRGAVPGLAGLDFIKERFVFDYENAKEQIVLIQTLLRAGQLAQVYALGRFGGVMITEGTPLHFLGTHAVFPNIELNWPN